MEETTPKLVVVDVVAGQNSPDVVAERNSAEDTTGFPHKLSKKARSKDATTTRAMIQIIERDIATCEEFLKGHKNCLATLKGRLDRLDMDEVA